MAAEVAFPASIGPFTMAGVNLARAFSAFYRNFGDFPKPDPASDENVMAGLDLAALGWTSFAEIVFCQLSPLHAITLDTETKDAANIPRLATHFAWAYPAVIEEAVLQAAARSHPTEQAFLQYGGYVYFDVRREIIGTNSICPAPLDTPGLVFGRAQALPEKVADVLTRQGRFQERARTYPTPGLLHWHGAAFQKDASAYIAVALRTSLWARRRSTSLWLASLSSLRTCSRRILRTRRRGQWCVVKCQRSRASLSSTRRAPWRRMRRDARRVTMPVTCC
mmetsp:Transcript_97456/g.271094  ORF Transcript_97456/g.271094 Transcript_97456/m.271094 type:complete len:279 (+) Transcript_97456:63-899(+)